MGMISCRKIGTGLKYFNLLDKFEEEEEEDEDEIVVNRKPKAISMPMAKYLLLTNGYLLSDNLWFLGILKKILKIMV